VSKWYENWTWLEYLNFIILQWFFIRLVRVIEQIDLQSITLNKEVGISGIVKKRSYKIKFGIIPLTGW